MSKDINSEKGDMGDKQLNTQVEGVGPKNLSSTFLCPQYLEDSAVIRNPNSTHLDARKIAQYFSMTLSELAGIIEVPDDDLKKAPDSSQLHSALQPFEKITRLRILFDFDDVKVRSWLNEQNEELAPVHGVHPCPMDIIKAGHPEIIAGMVNRAFTGEPS